VKASGTQLGPAATVPIVPKPAKTNLVSLSSKDKDEDAALVVRCAAPLAAADTTGVHMCT